MKQKNKSGSFTPPLQIPQIKKARIFLAALLKNPNEQKPQLLNSEGHICCFLLGIDCTGKEALKLLNLIMLNFVPTQAELKD